MKILFVNKVSASASRGISLVELLIASLAVLIGLSAFLQSIVGALHLARNNRHVGLAAETSRGVIERLRSEDPELVFAMYNGDATDDPPGRAPGRHFAVPGLRPLAGDADGFVGEILFPTRTPDSGVLSENPGSGFPNMPMDLNLDGDSADADVTADFEIVPVILRMQWQGPRGNMEFEVSTFLGAR